MKKTLKCFLHHSTNPWGEAKFVIHPTDMSQVEFMELVLVKPLEIEVDIPDDFDPRPQQIKDLRAKQQKAAADFQKLCTDIQRQISELEALEFTPAGAV